MLGRTHAAAAHPRLGLTGIVPNDVQVQFGMLSICQNCFRVQCHSEVCITETVS